MKKVHWVRTANVGPTQVTTYCGLSGPRVNSFGATDYLLLDGRRFNVSKRLSSVTCVKCLKARS